MRKVLSALVLLDYVPLYAGTGHTNDMGLMYLLILTVLGLILLFWNGYDYLSKNQKRIRIVLKERCKKSINFLIKLKLTNT